MAVQRFDTAETTKVQTNRFSREGNIAVAPTVSAQKNPASGPFCLGECSRNIVLVEHHVVIGIGLGGVPECRIPPNIVQPDRDRGG
jgi:hypothetical protein